MLSVQEQRPWAHIKTLSPSHVVIEQSATLVQGSEATAAVTKGKCTVRSSLRQELYKSH